MLRRAPITWRAGRLKSTHFTDAERLYPLIDVSFRFFRKLLPCASWAAHCAHSNGQISLAPTFSNARDGAMVAAAMTTFRATASEKT